MESFPFLDVFQENPDGSLTPKRTINVNGITFDAGTSFQKGVSFGGIDFHQYKYFPIAGEVDENGILVIKGFYKQ